VTWRFSATARFGALRFAVTFAAFSGRPALLGFATLEVAAVAVTFSGCFAGAADFGFLMTSLPGTTAGAGATATTAGGAALVLPFGRPPLRANCASANILRKASCASAINWTCETRRSLSALSFSARYIASAVVASIVMSGKVRRSRPGNA